ncbi:MAG: cobyric acid synthase [Roseobacter sp.]
MGRAIMLQGTGSDVGKSLLVAGLCRAAQARGLSVAPFKPQNMSNNAAVTKDGREIGRAQALQAQAAGLAPHSDMNPVLLKPESETGAQIIVQGKRFSRTDASDYAALKPHLLTYVKESFSRLKTQYDLVIVEGAGSPAEVNLRAGDIANMGFAQAADVPVILCGDINRGGVIAQLVGTQAVLDWVDNAQIKGFLINKFRGDPSLFNAGYDYIRDVTGWTGFGVLPWFSDAWRLPAEDAYDVQPPERQSGLHIVCLHLSRMANFDDLDPLAQEPGVRLTMLAAGQAIPGDADVVIVPGSKSTRADLAFLRTQGWDVDIKAHVRRGGHVLGLCGGYQMLGNAIEDRQGLEGPPGVDQGLGLLNLNTLMQPQKHVLPTHAVHCSTHQTVTAYQIHLGQTTGPDCQRPFAQIGANPEGAQSEDGRICGTYLHGLFTEDRFRKAWLAQFGTQQHVAYNASVENTLNALATHLEDHLDVDGVFQLAQ